MASLALYPEYYEPSIELPIQGDEKGSFPYSLAPRSADASLVEIVTEAKRLSESGQLRTILNKHRAIYFQNLGLKDAEQFSQFAHAFGWTPHEDIGNPVRRTVHAKNVATANEGPNTQPVYPHNEFGLSPHYPAYVLFYCASAPETGEFASR